MRYYVNEETDSTYIEKDGLIYPAYLSMVQEWADPEEFVSMAEADELESWDTPREPLGTEYSREGYIKILKGE